MIDSSDWRYIVYDVMRWQQMMQSRSCLKSTYLCSQHSKRSEIKFWNKVELYKRRKALLKHIEYIKAKRCSQRRKKIISYSLKPSTRSNP